jgi:hypothetical protein
MNVLLSGMYFGLLVGTAVFSPNKRTPCVTNYEHLFLLKTLDDRMNL